MCRRRRHVTDKADLIELESKDSDGLEGKENSEYGSRAHWELVSERLSVTPILRRFRALLKSPAKPANATHSPTPARRRPPITY